MDTNRFDEAKWDEMLIRWQQLIKWAAPTGLARWAIVPDVPGNGLKTLERWHQYAQQVVDCEISPAIAVQDGMTPAQVKELRGPAPEVICVGGTTEWKWGTVDEWVKAFPRVHVLRCNSPEKLHYLESIGVESCDGTGWNRGNRVQTEGIESWARIKPEPKLFELHPHVCRSMRNGEKQLFAV
jgi:hypothetical protein